LQEFPDLGVASRRERRLQPGGAQVWPEHVAVERAAALEDGLPLTALDGRINVAERLPAGLQVCAGGAGNAAEGEYRGDGNENRTTWARAAHAATLLGVPRPRKRGGVPRKTGRKSGRSPSLALPACARQRICNMSCRSPRRPSRKM